MKRFILLFFLMFIVVFFNSFSKIIRNQKSFSIQELRKIYSNKNIASWPLPFIDKSVEEEYIEIGVLPKVKYPKNNPYSKEKAALGKKLFFDPSLSTSGQISCASCHEPQLGWGDGKRISNGDKRLQGKRNSLTIVNIGYAENFFWDGRAKTLEDQVHFPIEDSVEMNTSKEQAVENIIKNEKYLLDFEKVFGDKEITFEKIAKAIATYERTIVSTKTKFDRFILGESDIYTDQEVVGLHLFRTKAKCVNCHYSPYFSDQKFHDVGLSYYGRTYEDLGQYNITKKAEDIGKFRTPTLREVTATGPWMHNGLFNNLEGILNMYNVGMPTLKRKPHQEKDSLFPAKSRLLHKLDLTKEEKKAVISFLKTLESGTSSRFIK